MHLEVTKDNTWRNYGKMNFLENFFFRKQFSPNFVFQQLFYHLGPRWKQEANGCHGCIWNEFSMRVGTHEIFQLNDMSQM